MNDLQDVIAKATEATMLDWFARSLTIVDGNLSRACAQAVIADIEKPHVLIPVRYSKSDPNQAVHRRLLEEALLETVSRLEQAIEGQIHRILHGAESDTSEPSTPT